MNTPGQFQHPARRARSAKATRAVLGFLGVVAFCVGSCDDARAAIDPAHLVIVRQTHGSPRSNLAAAELRRYIYLRTGDLPRISDTAPVSCDQIELTHGGPSDDGHYSIHTTAIGNHRKVTIHGGGDLGLLYGAYGYIEKLGVRFNLHGDVIPDAPVKTLPDVDLDAKPLFATRGILPFHDFFEGPDWWNLDDYKAYAVQLARMRMNFIGLHNYPERQEGAPGPEPSVWIGLPQDMDSRGNVTFSYPGFFANTLRPGWGNIPMKTSQYVGGAAELFEHDAYGPDTQMGYCPWPADPADCNTVFNRTAAMYREAFAVARGLGIKTCIGTETPLTIPQRVRDRIKAQGKDPGDAAVIRDLYEGIFQRITRAFPVDYYWLWTPEDWTWGGNKPGQFEATTLDVQAALAALEKLDHPLTLASCGWVLGPQQDRAALDKLLPGESPMSCINQKVGHAPVEASFERVQNRPKWAIPWLENDPNMTGPQPWVGRMFQDGSDALRYGCSGLLGIHWRTKVIGMNIAALAQAGWSIPDAPQPVRKISGAINGSITSFATVMAGTEESPVYQSVRYDTDGYQLDVPNGTYSVTLKLVEPAYSTIGARAFGIKLQGQQVVERIDVFEKAGKDRALDLDFHQVRVANGRLNLDFTRIIELPCIAGIVIQGTTDGANQISGQAYVRKINCGGPTWKDYEADLVATGGSNAGEDRSLGAASFYQDWAVANFGTDAGPSIGALFTRIDGRAFPEISQWSVGPGRVKPNATPWAQEATRYAFVDKAEALRPKVRGPGNLARYDYWLNTFRYTRTMAELGCASAELDRIMKSPAPDKAQALSARRELARLWTRMIRFQIAAVDTPGEMGTLANLEQQSRGAARLLDKHDAALEKILGAPLPPDCTPSIAYEGPARLVVPTVRSIAAPGESMVLKIITVDKEPLKSISLRIRPLGHGRWKTIPVHHIARSVHSATLPAAREDFEYHITALTKRGDKLVWPATAPAMNQTVVVADIEDKASQPKRNTK